MSNIELQFGDAALRVALDERAAPGLTSALRQAIPHASLAVHCQTAGAEFCVPVPFFHWHENRREPAPGDVGYASFGNYLCFYYGPMAERDGPTNIVGRLVSDPAELARVGHDLLACGAKRVRITNGGANAAEGRALRARPSSSGPFSRLCRNLLDDALAAVPEDIRRLRSARVPAMGNIAGRVQACGLLLAISEVLMNARTVALQHEISLAIVMESASLQLGRYSRWLAMAGMDGSSAWLTRMEQALRQTGVSGDEFIAGVEDALVAFGRLRFWAEAISPWHRLADEAMAERTWIDSSLAAFFEGSSND